jgi:hypothetical protein
MRAKPLQFQQKSPDSALDDHLPSSPAPVAPNAIAVACRVLFPWSNAANKRGRQAYPGVHGGPCALVQGRAAPRTVRDWCAGRRNAPRWFVAVLRDQLLVRRATIDAALEGLAAYEFGPGHAHGLRQYWCKRQETARQR